MTKPPRWKLYLILLFWISIYSVWNIIGRDVSTEGPVLRLLLVNCLRAFVATLSCFCLMICMYRILLNMMNFGCDIPVFLTTFVAFISACCLLLAACCLLLVPCSFVQIVQSFNRSPYQVVENRCQC